MKQNPQRTGPEQPHFLDERHIAFPKGSRVMSKLCLELRALSNKAATVLGCCHFCRSRSLGQRASAFPSRALLKCRGQKDRNLNRPQYKSMLVSLPVKCALKYQKHVFLKLSFLKEKS